MLRDGDSLFYLPKLRNLKVRMLDGAVKTLQVDESQKIEELMVVICQRIGTANHEEYGLCRENYELEADTTKPATGTLTLKKKDLQKKKDALLEQMSKKLKTDDNVEWLDQRKTLRELQVDPKETLLFKRRLYYSDHNVSSRDPVQLNLLYVQTREAILEGRQVVTEDKAVEFAGIQCQIQFGDFQEKKHKPGFIENLKEFLPEQNACSWGIEKKIIKMHQKYVGLSHVDAKHLYTKTARELPTYGVTFFLVKEQQKGKKKLVPRLLGINSESILRLHEETKEILQVWPLTQVKSYTAGSESFTLNFGDYSDKSYVVKTNEATRIKDILEGYIDIIRKKLAKPFNVKHDVGEAMCEDMVELSKATTIQAVVPSKIVQTSFVGPSQIISVNQGQCAQGQGTQIVTVRQVITSMRRDTSQQPMKGEIGNMEFGKRLNQFHSECVKTVILLSIPTAENLQQARKITNDLDDGMPCIQRGIREVAETLHGDASQKLLDELDELCNYMNTLVDTTQNSDLNNPDNLSTAQDAAKKVAELSTQMCFAVDPKIKRRSTLLKRSRDSFIQDEQTEATLRRASFLCATDKASQALEEAHEELDQIYNGPILSDDELKKLESKAVDRMGKLNAAIALLLNAHADPKNIDYEMAVNSMKTINEIMPKFVKDTKPLTGYGDSSSGRALREQIGNLLNRTSTICKLTGTHDVQKMQFEGDDYADVANKLIFTFSRSRKPGGNMHDEENKITAHCKDIEEKASVLLSDAKELTGLELNDPRRIDVDAAALNCSDAVKSLITCAKLTASSLHEPHCQSALSAAVENVSSSTQNLLTVSKPLVEKPNRHHIAHKLNDGSLNLSKALDRLKDYYSNINGTKIEEMDITEEPHKQDRLKFIRTVAAAKTAITDADKELLAMKNTPVSMASKPNSRNSEAKRLLSQKLAQLNAAIACLLYATADQANPDYDAAEAATRLISELTPDIIKDTKSMQGTVDPNSWNEIVSTLKDMLEATHGICVNAENKEIQELNQNASRFANPSGKLIYVLNRRKNPNKEKEIIDLSKAVLQDTSEMLANVYRLAETIGGKDGDDLDNAGVKVVDAAQLMLRTAEITAPTISEPHCKETLLKAIDSLSEQKRMIERAWKPFIQSSDFCQIGDDLYRDLNLLKNGLTKLRRACQESPDESDVIPVETSENEQQKIQRLKFIASKTVARNALTDADKHLDDIMNKPNDKNFDKENNDVNLEVPRRIADKLAELNAAIAKFLQYNLDKHNPDYQNAQMAINEICKLTPEVIRDTECMRGHVDDNSWNDILEHLRAILDATQGICSDSPEGDAKELNDAASKFAKSSAKLTYIFNPRKNPKKEEQIADKATSAVEETSQLLSYVYQLAESVGGDNGNKMDDAGARIVDTAEQLVKTAEITASSINNKHCRDTLLSAINRLLGELQDLEKSWTPFVNEPKHRKIGNQLKHELKSVQMALNNLKDVCQESSENDNSESSEVTSEMQERNKLKFITSKSSLIHTLTDADNLLDDLINKPVRQKSKDDITKTLPEVRRRLLEKLAELNATIASLLQACSDYDNPDYINAEMAINNIINIIPAIIKDTEQLHGTTEDKSWKEITDQLKSVLDATRDVCSNSTEGDVKEMYDAASKYAKSSGKLTYIFNPRKNPKREGQILQLARSAVEESSQMLSDVYQLAESVGGEDGNKLDDAGVKVVDVVQQLLKTAEITAPSIADTRCRDALLSAIDRLSRQLRDLENSWKPVVDKPKHRQIENQLKDELKSLKTVLDNLRQACLYDDDGKSMSSETQVAKTHKFMDSKSAVIKALKEADTHLDELMKKPVSKKTKSDIVNTDPKVQHHISKKLAELNAEITSLMQASSNHNNKSDYDIAETAINNVCKLTPALIKDTEYLHENVEDKAWKEIADHLKSLLVATQEMCSHSLQGDAKEMYDIASKFAKSSGKLTYIFNRHKNPKTEKQILDTAKSAVEETSQLLSNVYQLAESAGGEDGNKLDDDGVKVVDAAQQLLKTAEITSPTLEDVRCRGNLLSAIDRLSAQIRDLENTWKPFVDKYKQREIGNQLSQNIKSVEMVLDNLRNACQDGNRLSTNPDMPETKKLKFIATKSTANNVLSEADKQLKELVKKPVLKKSKNSTASSNPEVQYRMSQKIADLNAAIVTLLQTTSDHDYPDYDNAQIAVDNICKLTPAIINDTKCLRESMDDETWKGVAENLEGILNETQRFLSNSDKRDVKEMNDAVSKFTKSSGSLIYTFNPHTNPKKQEQISVLSRSAVEQISRMLSHTYQFAESVGGDGQKVDEVGKRVVHSAQQLLKTAEVTASSIANASCRTALLAAIQRLSDQLMKMEDSWKPLIKSPEHQRTADKLSRDLNLVQIALDKLKEACEDTNGTSIIKHPETQRLMFIATALTAAKTMAEAEKALRDNTPVKPLDKSELPAMKRSLSQRLARLNSTIASLVMATADEDKPDYNTATRSIDTIASITPTIIKDVKSIKTDIDQNSWKIIDENLNDVVVTTRQICRHVEDNNSKELKEAAFRCAKSVGRLSYIFSPTSNTRKENQILDLSREASEQTSLMMSAVHQLADKVGGDTGKQLHDSRVLVVKSSKILQKTAEILAPTISDANCQESLISSADELSKLSEQLKGVWKPVVQAPQLRQTGDQLEQNLQIVHTILDKLRKACRDTDDEVVAPTHINVEPARDSLKEAEKYFLEDNFFELSAHDLDKPGAVIKSVMEQREQISHKIGNLNESMALLLQAMLDLKNPDNVKKVEQRMDVISNTTPEIIKEMLALQRNVDDESREILFEEAKALYTAAQAVCDSVEKCNVKELNSVASQYSQTSRKLRYIISPRSYPNKEKKILDMSRSACEWTSLMLSRVSRLVQRMERGRGDQLDTCGAKVANAAEVLLNNAQITSSSINQKNCQAALVSSANILTEHTLDLQEHWMPIAQRAEHKEIGDQLRRDVRLLLTELHKLKTTCQDDTEEVAMEVQQQKCFNTEPKKSPDENIDRILEDIQKNVKEANTAEQNKATERLTVEDNPLRTLASKILASVLEKSDSARLKSKHISPNEQNELISFSNELQGAIKCFDITNAKCRNAPLDLKKRQDLENAIMNLQQICLLSLRKNEDHNNVVDLTNYINDVTKGVDDLSNTVDEIKTDHGKEALIDIKNKCGTIKDNARKILYLEEEPLADGNIIDDMLKIDQFAKDCESHVKHMNLVVSKINDENARNTLNDKLQSLAECCDLLRFATMSSISSAKSATLDEGLQNLEDVEKKIDIILKPTEGQTEVKVEKAVNMQAMNAAQAALATVVAAEKEHDLPKALIKYAAQMKAIGADKQKLKLKDHLKRLLDLLQQHAAVICRRVATWQDANGPETSVTTDKVLEECKSFAKEVEQSQKRVSKSSTHEQMLRESDIKNLLSPNDYTVKGTQKELNNKLYQQIQKLNSISSTIALSLHKPESLTRSLHATSDAAQHLAAIARGLKGEDPVQNKRIEEAVQETSIATYNLLKTSEATCHLSNPTNSRRRLLDTCRLLNEAINKLGRAAFPSDKMKNECCEMNRNIQLQLTFLQADSPTCALTYTDCLDALNNQSDVIQKLRAEEPIPRSDMSTSLRYVTSAVCNSAEFGAQTAYLLSLTDAEQTVAKQHIIDLSRLHSVTEAMQNVCYQVICAGPGEQATELNSSLMKQTQQLQEAIDDATQKVKDDFKHPLIANSKQLKRALQVLQEAVHLPTVKEEDFTLKIMKHIDAIKEIDAIIKEVPQAKTDKDPKKTNMSTEVIDHTKSLLTSTSMLVKKASVSEQANISWTMFGSGDVIKAFEALVTCIKEKGAEAGFIESMKVQEEQAAPKSFVHKQVELVNSWLRRPAAKDKDKAAGVKAAEHVVGLAEQMCEDLAGADREEVKQTITETKQLLDDCTTKYNSDKAYLLLERLKELRKMLEKGVVTRVVEDFLVDIPLDNLQTVQQETDARKRKFLLEKKIAELLAQLGRVKKTATLVADTGLAPRLELATTTDQAQLLAPVLVKAAQDRIEHSDDQAAIKHYEDLLQQYADSLSRVRELCDHAVDPIDFAQAAGETMHRIKEESAISKDPQKSVYTSRVILKLGNRVVKAGMKSSLVQNDPELRDTLAKIDHTVTTKYDDVKKADWGDVMAEIMKKTSEVESALGGENIFLKQVETNQPIFAAALDLHAAVREWSARDNEIVAVAKRMAVSMARLSDYMNTENKRELLHTSKVIVSQSREVAALAKKLALECTDMRIRTNLLQVCEQIPTISGQLKMLTTVKGSSFGQGTKEDQEAMNTLVGNAQNLMTSIQEVVKAAASASVKIMSQKGCRMKWVRRKYY
ncbi:uncharacterized protein LOC112051754 isoform X1 [Bicyclus anynana]|nr:uncharacterized protein LOC112051754 isoform X1 [Bicyclus anynana]